MADLLAKRAGSGTARTLGRKSMRAEPIKKEPTQLMANNKGKASVDQDLIRELAELLDETGLSEIEIERDGMRVRVARAAAVEAAAAAVRAAAAAQRRRRPRPTPRPRSTIRAKHPGCVQSPMVGTAYLAPSPAPPPSSRSARAWPRARRS